MFAALSVLEYHFPMEKVEGSAEVVVLSFFLNSLRGF